MGWEGGMGWDGTGWAEGEEGKEIGMRTGRRKPDGQRSSGGGCSKVAQLVGGQGSVGGRDESVVDRASS